MRSFRLKTVTYFWLLGVLILCLLVIYIVRNGPISFYFIAILWILTTIVLLWFGNHYIVKSLSTRYPWTRLVTKRFIIQVSISLVYSLICINSTFFLFKHFLLNGYPSESQFLVLNIYGLLFIVPIVSINFGSFFLTEWKKSERQVKELEKENLLSQFQSLQSHIDPHFLFNNLNILSTLIKEKKAIDFLENFADIYRYLLNFKGSELVTLSEELDSLSSYFYILRIRFSDALRIDISVPPELQTKNVLPLSIQMLIENAVKHNVISVNRPLLIKLFTEDNQYIVVKNNIQTKYVDKSKLTNTGLKNIINRYRYYTENKVSVIQTENEFIVKLPLIDIITDESTNN